MIGSLIDKYKNHRKQKFLNIVTSYKGKYAFVGVGGHSMSNLYTVIDYLRVPLKYIVTSREENAKKMALRYSDCLGTNNIDNVLDDADVAGVFLCASPAKHFDLSMQILKAGKHLFVEKPPCSTLEELDKLIAVKSVNQHVVVGFQKRYAAATDVLLKQRKKAAPKTYNYRYCRGAYPEGNALLDLFIHPLDYAIYLFGSIKAHHIIKQTFGGGKITYMLQLEHDNDIIGSLELSTAYSWNDPIESLSINTEKGIYELEGLNKLTFKPATTTMMGVPLEKVLKNKPKQEVLYNNSGMIPIAEYNSVNTQGYYGEVSTFINLIEGRNPKNRSSYELSRDVFALIQKL